MYKKERLKTIDKIQTALQNTTGYADELTDLMPTWFLQLLQNHIEVENYPAIQVKKIKTVAAIFFQLFYNVLYYSRIYILQVCKSSMLWIIASGFGKCPNVHAIV